MSRLVEAAAEAYHDGDFNACITHYNSVLSSCHQGDKSPRVAFLHSNRCQAWIALGEWDNAKTDAERTVLMLPSFVKGHYQVGLCEEQEGHLVEAATAYCTALQHVASIHKSRRKTTSALLLAKILRLACIGNGDDNLWGKLELGLTLAGWDRVELLRWLLRVNDWVAADLLVKRLSQHEKLSMEDLQQALVSNCPTEGEMKDSVKEEVLSESLSSAMDFALTTGNLIPLQLLLRYNCQAANSKDVSDAANNSLLHQICIMHNTKAGGSMDENKANMLDPAFVSEWLMTQGLNCDLTNRDGKKPADLLLDKGLLWNKLQSTSNTDLVKDLAYMEAQEIENFLLSQFCTLRKFSAVDLIAKIPDLPEESVEAIKTATDNKRRNTAWRALVQGVQAYAEGLLQLVLALHDVAPVQSKLVLLVFSNRCARRLWRVCPEVLSLYRNWSALVQIEDIKDIVAGMKSLPSSLQHHILRTCNAASNHQRAFTLILIHHLVGEVEVKDFIQALQSTGNVKLAELIKEDTSLIKEKLPKVTSTSFKCLKESPFTTFEDIPAENAFAKHRRRKTSARVSRSSRQNELDYTTPEPLKDFELELANQVTSCPSAAIYMPLMASHVAITAAVVQRHIWTMNDEDEDPKENALQGATSSSQKNVPRSKSCDAGVRNVALKSVEANQGAASVCSSPRKRKKSGRNMTDDHDEYVVGRHVANIEGPLSPRSRDASRPSPSKSPRRGRAFAENRQVGTDYSPSPCREGRRGRKSHSPGLNGHLSRQGKPQQSSKPVEEECSVETDPGSKLDSAKSETNQTKSKNQVLERTMSNPAANSPSNYSVLVQVPQWEDVSEVTKSLSLYLPHLNIVSHGVNKSSKVGLLRLLDSSDVVVTSIKSTRNCLGAKSLSLSDLTLLVSLNIQANDLENGVMAAFDTRGVQAVRSIVVISELLSSLDEFDSKRKTLDGLNCSHLVHNKHNRLQLYQQMNNSTKCLQFDVTSGNFQEELDSHLATCYGSQDGILGVILGATEDLQKVITETGSSSLPVTMNVINFSSNDLEAPSKVKGAKSRSGCTFVFSSTSVDANIINNNFPNTNFVLMQSGNQIDLVYGDECSKFVSIFLNFASCEE